ncbi:MAG: ArnT family glycosyltransferase, partial [Thermomicrobiales bacterium]
MLTQLTQPKALLRGIALTRDQARRAMLAMIMVLAAILRLNGRNWDQSQYLHPDERFMTMVATGIKWPSSLGMYFDSANSPLNPYNRQFGSFVYGTFPLFLGKLAGTLTNQNVYGNFHLSGRLLSALFDLGTVLLVYAVATRLFGATAGLLGSLLMACSVLNIQSAHFFTSDSFVTMFCIAVFFVALRCHDRGRWWEYLALGVVAGLAVSSKLSALPIVGVLALPAAETLRLSGWRSLRRSSRPRALAPLLGTLLAGIGALWTFRIAQPYA